MTTPFTTQDWCQLYRLLDRMPDQEYEQSYRNNISDVWELVRGRLMGLDLDPDDVLDSGQTPSEAWEMLSGFMASFRAAAEGGAV